MQIRPQNFGAHVRESVKLSPRLHKGKPSREGYWVAVRRAPPNHRRQSSSKAAPVGQLCARLGGCYDNRNRLKESSQTHGNTR